MDWILSLRWLQPLAYLGAVILAIIGVYVLVRTASLGYFKSKAEYERSKDKEE